MSEKNNERQIKERKIECKKIPIAVFEFNLFIAMLDMDTQRQLIVFGE